MFLEINIKNKFDSSNPKIKYSLAYDNVDFM